MKRSRLQKKLQISKGNNLRRKRNCNDNNANAANITTSTTDTDGDNGATDTVNYGQYQ